MTDGEKARIQDAFNMLAKAVSQTSPENCFGRQSLENFVYANARLVMGWVLEEEPFYGLFEAQLKRLRSQGVQPLMTMIEKHKKN